MKSIPLKNLLQILFILILISGCSKKEFEKPPTVLSSGKGIISFKFLMTDNPSLVADVSGRLTRDSIYIDVPNGTDITNLLPSINFSASSISPNNKSRQDFSSPVVYSVTAEDGSFRSYTVVVRVFNELKEIISFIFKKEDNPALTEDVVGKISGNSIELAVPPGVALDNLIPTIEYHGISISPEGRISNDFSSPVYYTVTADDMSTRAYAIFARRRDVFAVGTDGYLYDFNAYNGEPRWRYFTGGSGTPAFENGTVFVEGSNHVVYAIDVNSGNLKWTSIPPQGDYGLGMPVAKYGKLFFGGSGSTSAPGGLGYYAGFVLCLNQQTGAQEWISNLFTGYSYTDSRPTNVAVEDNIACVYDMMNGAFAFNVADGSPAWGRIGAMLGRSSPAIANGQVFYGIELGIEAVSSSDGHDSWLVHNNLIYSSPTVENGIIYTTSGNQIFSFNGDGSIRWTVSNPIDNTGFYSALAYHNMLFLTTGSFRLCVFSAADGSLKFQKDGYRPGLVLANNVIFASDSRNRLTCMDASTGNIIWVNLQLGIFPYAACVGDSHGEAYYVAESGGQN